MRRAALLYALIVLLPAAQLTWWAWRAVDLEHREGLEAYARMTREFAKLEAAKVEAAAREAANLAEASPVAGYAEGGRWIGYDPAAPPARAPEEPEGTPEERRRWLLSRRGGEAYEARGDPGRALDAYAFYLPAIRAPELRSRLRLAGARAARAAGQRDLARGLLREVFATGEGHATEEGPPADLAAAVAILHEGCAEDEPLRAEARSRLRDAAPRLATPLLARLAAEVSPGGEDLRGLVEARRTLEAAVRACPEVLAWRDAAIAGSTLLLARGEERGGRRVRALRSAPFVTPELALEGYWLQWVPGETPPPGGDAASHPVRLADGGPVLGQVLVQDLPLPTRRDYLDRRRWTKRAFIGLQVLVVLGGGAAFLIFLRRERELARLRARLLANVSHELKTPVTSVRMFSEMLSEPGLDPAQARLFGGHLRREAARLSQLLENLLDLSRPERAEAELAREPADLAALLREVAEGFAYRAREEKAAFRTEGVDGSLPLETNPGAVERIVLNLLDNALKYRRAEGAEVVLSLAAGSSGAAGGGARNAVRDNGPGNPRGERERVFEEFDRGRFVDYAVKGAGLGLPIARRLARRLGGDLELESREGEGSVFT
ncbi:MAG: HAMP domain-containing histidine kinase, partial [Planctomycetes bacterium]|nr:HAMP domain-containing histidine kinase [Planctomycetota bacterium]